MHEPLTPDEKLAIVAACIDAASPLLDGRGQLGIMIRDGSEVVMLGGPHPPIVLASLVADAAAGLALVAEGRVAPPESHYQRRDEHGRILETFTGPSVERTADNGLRDASACMCNACMARRAEQIT